MGMENCIGNTDKSNTDLLKNVSTYTVSNLLRAKEISLFPYYPLKDINGNIQRIDSVFVKPRLVFRFSEFCCENCIKSSIELISKSGIEKNIVGFASYNNLRMLRMAVKKYNIAFPVFLVPMNDVEMLSEQNEKSKNPYLFLLDNDFKGRYFFTPSQQYPEFLQEYLVQFSAKLGEWEKINVDIFDEKNKDLGTVVRGQKYKVEFKYTNTTNKLLVIQNVESSCGCLVSSWERDPLSPGKAGNIVVEFTPESLGYTSKTIIVSHNLSTYPIRLKIKADVGNVHK